jgi:hypothetical protein
MLVNEVVGEIDVAALSSILFLAGATKAATARGSDGVLSPLQGEDSIGDAIQGWRAAALTPGYLMSRLRREDCLRLHCSPLTAYCLLLTAYCLLLTAVQLS